MVRFLKLSIRTAGDALLIRKEIEPTLNAPGPEHGRELNLLSISSKVRRFALAGRRAKRSELSAETRDHSEDLT